MAEAADIASLGDDGQCIDRPNTGVLISAEN